MFLLSMLLAASAGSFDPPDTLAWKVQVDSRLTSYAGLPGSQGFFASDPALLNSSGSDAQAIGGQLQVVAKTPEWHGISPRLGFSFGVRRAHWSSQVVLARGAYTEASMTLTSPLLEVIGGAEYRILQRHFLSVDLLFPVPLAIDRLEYDLGGLAVHSGSAPASFALSRTPHPMIGYDYRLFDRIDIGFGFSPIDCDYFRRTPRYVPRPISEQVLSDKPPSSSWFEYHIGWTFSI